MLAVFSSAFAPKGIELCSSGRVRASGCEAVRDEVKEREPVVCTMLVDAEAYCSISETLYRSADVSIYREGYITCIVVGDADADDCYSSNSIAETIVASYKGCEDLKIFQSRLQGVAHDSVFLLYDRKHKAVIAAAGDISAVPLHVGIDPEGQLVVATQWSHLDYCGAYRMTLERGSMLGNTGASLGGVQQLRVRSHTTTTRKPSHRKPACADASELVVAQAVVGGG